jgi:hypothetical protein
MFHICPQEIMAFMMALPFIGFAAHWVRHKLVGDRCQSDKDCVPKCNHQVIQKDEVEDLLDP